MKEILKISKKYGIKIIEDAAHAAGANYGKNKIGSHGFAVCFSFHPIKNLAMPTGGLISINDKKYKNIREKIQTKRWCGISNRHDGGTADALYDINEIGDNYYMNEISAVIGIEQLKKLNKMNSIRKKIAKRYASELEMTKKMAYSNDCAYHLYWICVKNRDKLRKKLLENGIQTGTHYRPIHTFRLYHNKKIKLPVTDRVGNEIITLPIHPNLTDNQVTKVISLINKFS
jgi:dTDP-4-amino-4,6-dideoxygalactose transaminase